MSQRAKPEQILSMELSRPSMSAVSRLPDSQHRPGREVETSPGRVSGNRSAGGLAWALLGKADALLVESVNAGSASERFRCAYLAALRGAGAVLAVGGAGTGTRRKKNGNAWTLLDTTAPTFGAWSNYFAGWSATRAAIETGLRVEISDADSDAFSVEVGRFLTAVEEFVGRTIRITAKAS